MLGSLTFYRRVLNDNIFANPSFPAIISSFSIGHSQVVGDKPKARMPVIGHAIAGAMAGWTVSFIAAPIEHVKARLQIQYAVDKATRLYKGPIDCARKLVR